MSLTQLSFPKVPTVPSFQELRLIPFSRSPPVFPSPRPSDSLHPLPQAPVLINMYSPPECARLSLGDRYPFSNPSLSYAALPSKIGTKGRHDEDEAHGARTRAIGETETGERLVDAGRRTGSFPGGGGRFLSFRFVSTDGEGLHACGTGSKERGQRRHRVYRV